MADFIGQNSQVVTRVRSPQGRALKMVLEAGGAQVERAASGGWEVRGPDAPAIGELARRNGIALHELSPLHASLEEVYTEMTRGSAEYRAGGTDEDRLVPQVNRHSEIKQEMTR
jgi:ABC-2 type transport system ATP-binding protein